MSKFVVLLIFSILTFNSFACLHASQNRVFPLGLSNEGFVFMELRSVRGEQALNPNERDDEMLVEWRAVSSMCIYNKSRQLVRSEILDSNIKIGENQYLKEINKTFEKGWWKASQLPGFVAARPIELSFCNYLLNCKKVGIELDTVNFKMYLKLSEKNRYEVDVLNDPTSIASNYLEIYEGYDYDSEKEKKLFLIQELHASSVRTFQIGEYTMTVVHLGIGSNYSEEPELEYGSVFEFKQIESSVFEEPVLYHGHGFDFFILNL